MRKLESRFHFSLDTRHPGVRKVFRLMLPVVLGLSLPGVYALILQWFGSYYETGVNTWLDNANKLMLAPVGIFGQSLAIGAFPALAQFVAQERMDLYRSTLAKTLRTVIYITLPVTAIMLASGPEIVQAVYQHGKFTSGDTAQVAQMLALFGIGIFAWCLHPVLMRGFFALQNTWLPIGLGTGTTLLFIAIVAVTRSMSMGPEALPLASSICAIVLVLALLAAMRAKVGSFGIGGIAATFAKSLIASGIVGGATWVGINAITTGGAELGKVGALTAVAVSVLLGGWAYYFLTRAMRMPETDYLLRALNRKGSGDPPETPTAA
jgi:putative peptidoglycan lipid II flippase